MTDDAHPYLAEPDAGFAFRLEGELLARLATRAGTAVASDVTLVELAPPPPSPPPVRQRRRMVAAAVAAIVVIIGGVVYLAGEDTTRNQVPAGPAPTTTTLPTTPSGHRALPIGAEPPLPPEGLPSSAPEVGEMVAGIAFSRFTNAAGWAGKSLNLFADGRLILLPAGDIEGQISEQRLSPEGVEHVRSEILTTGLFAGGEPTPGRVSVACACTMWVRDGDRVVTVDASSPGAPTPEFDERVDLFVDFITNLDASLAASEWADREVKPFVPSRYQVCVGGEDDKGNGVPLTDPHAFLARRLPGTVADILADITTATPVELAKQCTTLTLPDTRRLLEGLADAAIPHDTWVPRMVYGIADAAPGTSFIDVSPLLPDLHPALMAPG